MKGHAVPAPDEKGRTKSQTSAAEPRAEFAASTSFVLPPLIPTEPRGAPRWVLGASAAVAVLSMAAGGLVGFVVGHDMGYAQARASLALSPRVEAPAPSV